MAHLLQDLQFAWRSFSRTPGAALLAISTLAIGIGANTAIFSVIHSVLLHPLPYSRADRLALLWRQDPAIGGLQMSPSRSDAERWRTATTLEGITVYSAQSFTLAGGDEPEQVVARTIEPTLFQFLGVRPVLGRPFVQDDAASAASARVALLGNALWQRRFGADPSIVGRTISLSDEPYTVIGVMPPGFRLPLGKGDLWLPLVMPAAGAKAAPGGSNVLARLKPGVTIAAAEAELTAKMGESDMPGVAGRWHAHLMLPGDLAGPTFRRALMVLLGAVACVLLIGCANIAALLLARNAARTREIAVRVALGATRGRLVRQLLTESLLLSIAGGVAGLMVGVWILDALELIRPARMEQLENVSLSPQMFGVAAALALLTGLLFGVLPALAGTRVSLNDALKQSTRLMSYRQGSLARRALTVAEVALACVLLVGAGLLIRSYGRLVAASPGFQPEHRIAMHVALPSTRYATPAARTDFYSRLLAQIRAMPGVQTAALAQGVPPNGGLMFGTLEIEGRPANGAGAFGGGSVGPDYFKTLGIPIVDGREFVDTDASASPAIVNQTAAKRYWPGRSAIGKRLRFGAKSPWMTVVAVAGDLNTNVTFGDVQIYSMLSGRDDIPDATLVAQASGDPAAIAGTLKGQVWSIDPRVPVTDMTTMNEAMSASMSRPRFNLVLLAAFALVGLLLAAIGIYGVISYSVGQRTQEIGLRMALGALPADIRRTVMGEALILSGTGLAIGVAGALLVTRVMTSMLYEVSPADPASFAVTVMVLGGTALAAAWVPARRAMRVDPMIALRAD